jgi:hypothetical protein
MKLLLAICLGSAVVSAVVTLLLARVFEQLRGGKGVGLGLVAWVVVALLVQAGLDAGKSGAGRSGDEAGPETPSHSAPSTSSTPEASPSPTEATTPDEPSESEPEPSSTTPAGELDGDQGPAGVGPQLYRLADLDPTHTEREGWPGNCTGGCTGFEPGSGRIAGEVYPSSYLMDVAGDGRYSIASWNIARRCTTLDMTAGLDDENAPDANVTFTISLDGGPRMAVATVGLSQPGEVRGVSVRGAARVEVGAYVSGPEVDDEVPIVLGDAQLTCDPGTLGDES